MLAGRTTGGGVCLRIGGGGGGLGGIAKCLGRVRLILDRSIFVIRSVRKILSHKDGKLLLGDGLCEAEGKAMSNAAS